MPRFSAEQVRIAKALMPRPKTLGELRDELSLPADVLAAGLKALVKERMVESRGPRFALSGQVNQLLEEKGAKKQEVGVKGVEYVVKMIVEGASETREALENQMNILEGKLKQEKVRILYLKRAEPLELKGENPEEQGDSFTTYLDVEAAAPSFAEIVRLIVQFGPSSIELISPDQVTLNSEDAQRMLNDFASAIHYYATLVIQLGQALSKQAKPD